MELSKHYVEAALWNNQAIIVVDIKLFDSFSPSFRPFLLVSCDSLFDPNISTYQYLLITAICKTILNLARKISKRSNRCQTNSPGRKPDLPRMPNSPFF